MTEFVIRQISPPGASSRANEATVIELARAAIERTVEVGAYLEWSDPDANNGFGFDSWTMDIAKAKRFATFIDATECWKAQSKVRPYRDDGKPNRPLTAYSITIEKIEAPKNGE